ncbi:MAG TPA: MauE/DoxX family redox-associated membrane protein [Chitinophagaceae bacterium]|nr:MauE/DoxX family redox-associated membrane protein [Chitinophagaceae bacterium]
MLHSRNKLLIDIIAAIFILLFTYTAISKLRDHTKFYYTIRRSPLIGDKAAFVSWALPFNELFVAALLFFLSTRALGLKISFALMVLFTLYIGYMLAFTSHLPCSCGGVISHLSWKNHLYLNIGLTLLAGWGIWLMNKTKKQMPFQYSARV